jgi:hypothetical protein
MATGRLGIADLAAVTNTTLYTVPTGYFTVATVSVVDRSNQSITIRMAVSGTATPTAAEWIEYDCEIYPKGVLERTGLVIGAGQNIVLYSSTANVGAVAFGIETSTT